MSENTKRAFNFILILGLVNLFSDMTYEGASSINGPFLGMLEATALTIGIISGVGEFLGYALRFIAGYISDKTGKQWLMTFIGYAINLLAVPALAFVSSWQAAAFFIIAERVGRAIRKPTIEAMLSYTTSHYGKGWVYGVNTALDQLGATLGPLLIAVILFMGYDFKIGYAFLLIPALLALATLTIARIYFPEPAQLEPLKQNKVQGFTKAYWLYMFAGACVAAGLLSFEMISFHFAKTAIVSRHWIPLFFALAMAVDAIASLFFGRLFDRIGIKAVVTAILFSGLYAPFVFLGDFYLSMLGMILWGIGFGAQDTLLKAIIAGILPEGKRSLAFGLFYTIYGLGWLLGSVIGGFLYGHSLIGLVGFSVAVQLASLPLFLLAKHYE